MQNIELRNNSPSPTRQTLGDKISSIGAKISHTFSHNDREERDSISQHLPILHSPKERSQSRGREALQSTGRGGFGNIRETSTSRDREGPNDFSVTRGREPVSNPAAIYSTGRGGAGNLRSPSRDASRGPDRLEKDVIESYVAAQGETPVSTGRGGLGNINRSRSRDPSGARLSTGRGGAGNIHGTGVHDGYDANAADEVERKKHETSTDGPHATGRGGFGNIVEQEEPALERPSFSSEGTQSTGRGGRGNILKA